jgi:nucleoside 2-deoxyribosyltransferase
VDSGTAAEIGFASALGLRCFGVRTDLRESGEAGVSVNLQVEHFLVASGGTVCASLDQLVQELRSAAR